MAALSTPGMIIGTQPIGPLAMMSAIHALRLDGIGHRVEVRLMTDAPMATPPAQPSPTPAPRRGVWASRWGAR